MKTLALGLSLAALAACGVAFAQQASQHDHGAARPEAAPTTRAQAQEMAVRMFDRMDANRDGKVDASDRDARRTEKRSAMFEQMDANRDGQISRDEFMAFKPAGHKGRDGAMGGHGMHGPMGGQGMGDQGEEGHMGMRGHGMGHGMRGMGMGGMGGMMMHGADANRDGAVSRDEFMAAFSTHLDEVDANRDGNITPEERRAAHQRMHARMGGHGPGVTGGATPPAPKGN